MSDTTNLSEHAEEAVPTKRKIDLVKKFREEKLFAFGVIIVALAIFLAFFGPIISPYNPNFATGNVSVGPPSILDWPRLFIETVFSLLG